MALLSPEARQERAALAFIRSASLDDFEYRSYLQASGKWRERFQYTDAQFACITDVSREDFAKLLLPGTRDFLPRQERKRTAV